MWQSSTRSLKRTASKDNNQFLEFNKFEFNAEKIIANAGSFALAIILFFGIYEVTVIFGFT